MIFILYFLDISSWLWYSLKIEFNTWTFSITSYHGQTRSKPYSRTFNSSGSSGAFSMDSKANPSKVVAGIRPETRIDWGSEFFYLLSTSGIVKEHG
jgi:hypothetical protein